MSKQVFLLDAYAMLYRAHFAFIRNPLRNSRGEDTSALFGLLLQLGRLLEKCAPEYLAFVFDSGKPTFRHQMYSQYKATREKMPEDMRSQIAPARELIERGLRIPICELEGFEADDVIGTLARRIAAAGMEAVIVSGDKDFYQLIGPGVKLYNPHGQGEDAEWVDTSNAHERLGVTAGQTVDLLALMGDSSDNVPGVRGIGKVTAVKLLQEFGSLDSLYERLDQVKPEGVRNKLTEGRDQALLSRELVTIRTDLVLPVTIESLQRQEPDAAVLDELFRRHEIFKLRERFGLGFNAQAGPQAAPAESAAAAPAHDYRLVVSLDALDDLITAIRAKGVFAVDTETTSLDPLCADLVGVSLAWELGVAYYIPVAHAEGPNLDRGSVLARLKPLLESESVGCIGQNIKYDLLVFSRYGIAVRAIVGDPMLASYLLDPGRRSHGLDSLALWLFNHKMISYEEVTGRGKEQVLFDRVPVDAACAYSAEDADMALAAALELERRLNDQGGLLPDLYRKVELPLIPVLAR
ncbi:DNA polymerase I, partial [bacterium]|nr:DNA polymerase I [bacterium]